MVTKSSENGKVQPGMPVDVLIRFCDILEKIALLTIAHINSVLMSGDLNYHF